MLLKHIAFMATNLLKKIPSLEVKMVANALGSANV